MHGRPAVANRYLVQPFWGCFQQQVNTWHKVSHIGEIIIHISMIVAAHCVSVKNGFYEFEQSYIGATPRAVGL